MQSSERTKPSLLFSNSDIFKSEDKATEMEEAAGGSGVELFRIIRTWGSTAKAKDRALVTEERNAVVKERHREGSSTLIHSIPTFANSGGHSVLFRLALVFPRRRSFNSYKTLCSETLQ